MASLSSKTEALLERYAEVFEEGLGPMNTFEASLSVKPGCKPLLLTHRSWTTDAVSLDRQLS